MIHFTNVKWKNFLSTGNKFSTIAIDETKTTLMIGTNGAGKSTMMDAISFGLFGKPFRKIKIGQLVNSINRKGMMVELEFKTGGKDYLIKRGLKPAKFEIYVDGAMQDQDAAARDQQDFLEKYILKMNEKSFRQIVVLGSGSFVPFMRLGAGERRSIIEELLDIQIFGTMNDLVKERVSDNKKILRDLSHQIELLEQNINLQESHLKSMNEDKQSFIDKKQAFVVGYVNEIKALELEIIELESKTKGFSKLNTQSVALAEYHTTFVSKIDTISTRIRNITDNSSCPTCEQEIDIPHQKKMDVDLSAKRSDLKVAVADVKERISKITFSIRDIQKNIDIITNKNHQITNLNSTCNRLNSEISEALNEKVETVDNEELQSKKQQMITNHDDKYSLQEDKHHLNTVQELLKDSGIKTVVIKNYLPLINQLINKYLSALNFYINFELDENFNETIKSRGRDEFAYGSFSEGEKLRIDLALLFTWREIAKLKSSVATNLLILDEIFDSSLDSTGIEDFLGILNSLGTEANAFVISHKGQQIIDKFGRVIKITKDKNFSKIASD
jgi:DNA repair exonuclease SbcCD ATPase subunit